MTAVTVELDVVALAGVPLVVNPLVVVTVIKFEDVSAGLKCRAFKFVLVIVVATKLVVSLTFVIELVTFVPSARVSVDVPLTTERFV